MEQVYFVVNLKPGIDGYAVKPDLEALAQDITIHVRDYPHLGIQHVFGSTSQTSYERAFNARLAYRPYAPDPLNNPSRQSHEWVELVPATVPASLQDRIARIWVPGAARLRR
jgi:hypothetical protein